MGCIHTTINASMSCSMFTHPIERFKQEGADAEEETMFVIGARKLCEKDKAMVRNAYVRVRVEGFIAAKTYV